MRSDPEPLLFRMSVRRAHPNSLAAVVSDPKSPETETELQLDSDSRQGGQSSSCRTEKSGGCPSMKSSPSMTNSPPGEPDADHLLQRRRSQPFNEEDEDEFGKLFRITKYPIYCLMVKRRQEVPV